MTRPVVIAQVNTKKRAFPGAEWRNFSCATDTAWVNRKAALAMLLLPNARDVECIPLTGVQGFLKTSHMQSKEFLPRRTKRLAAVAWAESLTRRQGSYARPCIFCHQLFSYIHPGRHPRAAGFPSPTMTDEILMHLAILRVCVWRAALSISECKR